MLSSEVLVDLIVLLYIAYRALRRECKTLLLKDSRLGRLEVAVETHDLRGCDLPHLLSIMVEHNEFVRVFIPPLDEQL